MERIHLSSQSDSGWPIVLIAVALGSFAAAITPTGNRLCKEFLESLAVRNQPVALARPDVLLIGDNPSDQMNIAMTIAPRGYNLVLAENVATGLERLRADANRIGLIVLDSRLAGVRSVAHVARVTSPEARLITLHPRHTTADLVGLLLNSIQN